MLGIIAIIIYCIDANNKHWKKVEFSAQVMMERQLAKENKKGNNIERFLPLSEKDIEESEDEMEEQDFLGEVI